MISWRVEIVCDRCGAGEHAIASAVSGQIAAHLPIGWEPNHLGQQLCTTCKSRPAPSVAPHLPAGEERPAAEEGATEKTLREAVSIARQYIDGAMDMLGDAPVRAAQARTMFVGPSIVQIGAATLCVVWDTLKSARAALAPPPAPAPAAGQKGEPATPEKP